MEKMHIGMRLIYIGLFLIIAQAIIPWSDEAKEFLLRTGILILTISIPVTLVIGVLLLV